MPSRPNFQSMAAAATLTPGGVRSSVMTFTNVVTAAGA